MIALKYLKIVNLFADTWFDEVAGIQDRLSRGGDLRKLIPFEVINPAIPTRMPLVSSNGSVGYDIFTVNKVNLYEGKIVNCIRTNLKLKDVPSGYFMKLENKSSSMWFVMGGIFDVDYTGEILIRIYSLCRREIFPFKAICQAVFVKYTCPLAPWIMVKRGTNCKGACTSNLPEIMFEKKEDEKVEISKDAEDFFCKI